MKKLLILIIGIFFIFSCTKKVEVATVGEKRIFESQVEQRLNKVNPQTIQKIGENEAKKRILDALIAKELILKELKDKKINQKKEAVNDWKQMEESFKIRYFINRYVKNEVDLPEEKLRKTYEDKKELFKEKEKVKANQILLKTGNENHTDEEAKKIAQDILKKLEEDNSLKNFKKLAKKYSEGQTAKNSGYMGYITRGRMVKPLEKAAFSLKPGTFNKTPIKTRFGYHIVYVEEHKEEGYKKFEDVKNDLTFDTYKRVMKEKYQMKLNNVDITKVDNKSTTLGTVEKLGIKYQYKDLKKDLKKIVPKKHIDTIIKNKTAVKNALEQLLMRKIYEKEIEEISLSENKDYQKYLQDKKDEFFANYYVENYIFADVSVTQQEVDQFYNYIRNSNKYDMDKVSREQIKNSLIQRKRAQKYQNHVEKLKSQYDVNIKADYSSENKK